MNPKSTFTILFFLTLTLAGAQQRDALVEYRNGNYETAVEITLEEISADSLNLDAYTVLTWALLRLERYQDVLDYGAQAMDIRRYDYRIIESMGEAYFYLGRNAEAMENFREYSVLNPLGDRIDLVYYFMGEIHLRRAEYRKADIAFSTAVYHTSGIGRWWARLGYARQLAEDWSAAREAYQESLRLSPNLAEARRGLRQVEEQINQG